MTRPRGSARDLAAVLRAVRGLPMGAEVARDMAKHAQKGADRPGASILGAPAVRRGKYGTRLDPGGVAARTVNGIVFASKRESDRYQTLAMMLREGTIRKLRTQVDFGLHDPGMTRIGKYVADFVYEEQRADGYWCEVVEDAKGFRTQLYRWKKKHTEAEYGIEIRET